MKIFSRLKLLVSYGPELDDLIHKEKAKKVAAEIKRKSTYLKLCETHQQEENHSHYAEHNCDYCRLLKKVENT